MLFFYLFVVEMMTTITSEDLIQILDSKLQEKFELN